jgi:general secretion pathway protein H
MVRLVGRMKMLISARMDKPKSSAEAGFTLVELMVVLAIMGLAAAAVMLTLPDGGHASRDEADRLAARLAAVRDLAVVEGRGTAAVLRPSGYGFEQRLAGEWRALDGRAFGERAWARDVTVQMDGGEAQARVLFSRLGTSPTPQSVTLTSDGAVERIIVTASGEIRRGE